MYIYIYIYITTINYYKIIFITLKKIIIKIKLNFLYCIQFCCVVLKKKEFSKKKKKRKEVFPAKANPKENSSERATVMSKHGEYSPLLSLAGTTATRKLEQRTLMGATGLKLEKALEDQSPEGERYFGLENFGNTCYCNNTLQVQSESFCFFFLFFFSF